MFSLSEGLGFQESKITFAYGAPISDTLRFHVDGFYVKGDGLRDQGFPGETGYQIKANLTKDLPDDKGYIRFYFKRLDDEEPYTAGGPTLVSVNGNKLSNLSPYPGFDSRTGTNLLAVHRAAKDARYSGYNNADGGLNASGQQKTTDIILQQEIGLKNKGSLFSGSYSVEATIFHNSFGVSNYDLTQPVDNRYFFETYSAKGLEFEGTYHLGGFSVTTQVTYTDAKVDSNLQGPDPQHLTDLGSGYLPGGTPKVTFVVAPTYRWKAIAGGVVVQGQSQENIGNATPFYAPAQYFVDAFGSYDLGSGISVGLHANNVFNKIGIAGGSNVSSIAALQAQGQVNGKYFVSAPAEFGRGDQEKFMLDLTQNGMALTGRLTALGWTN